MLLLQMNSSRDKNLPSPLGEKKTTLVIHSFPKKAHTEKLLGARVQSELGIYSPKVKHALTNISSPLFHGIRKYYTACHLLFL